jgi:hypothetical protein
VSKRGLSAFTGIWILFKLGLSAVLLLGVGGLFWLGLRHGFPDWVFGIMGGLVFFAALPWVNFQRPSRALGLVIVVFGLMTLLLAGRIMLHPEVFPQDCSSRRRGVLCIVENGLFEVGGALLAGLPYALAGLALLLIGARLVWRLRRQPGGHAW